MYIFVLPLLLLDFFLGDALGNSKIHAGDTNDEHMSAGSSFDGSSTDRQKNLC